MSCDRWHLARRPAWLARLGAMCCLAPSALAAQMLPLRWRWMLQYVIENPQFGMGLLFVSLPVGGLMVPWQLHSVPVLFV